MKVIRSLEENPNNIPNFVVFGSPDSRDIDIIVEIDQLPSLPNMCHDVAHALEKEIQQKCYQNDSRPLNVNLGTFAHSKIDGQPATLHLTSCWKGDIDETNNSIYYTAKYHDQGQERTTKQQLYLVPKLTLERNVSSKVARTVRTIVSSFTRVTGLRIKAKEALRSNFRAKLTFLIDPEVNYIDYNLRLNPRKESDLPDNLKKLAFQIGQTVDLIDGIESYTKGEIVKRHPCLKNFIYYDQDKTKDELTVLDLLFREFIEKIGQLKFPDHLEEVTWNHSIEEQKPASTENDDLGNCDLCDCYLDLNVHIFIMTKADQDQDKDTDQDEPEEYTICQWCRESLDQTDWKGWIDDQGDLVS